MANSGRLTVYLETSLDTRLVLSLSSDDTAASLKRKIATEHLAVFPAMGEITVQAVKTSFRGMMFTVTDSVPVFTLHDAINETVLLYVDAAAVSDERVLRSERVEEEGVKVPVGSTIEESMLIEPPRVEQEALGDSRHDPAGGYASVVYKSEKKRHKKRKPSGDISVISTEGRKSEDGGFEGNLVQEEPGHVTLERKKKVNIQANNPVDPIIVNFDVENHIANGDKSKKDESGKGEQLRVEGRDIGVGAGERRKRKKNKAVFPEVLTQETSFRENESCKENASNSVLEKDKSEVGTADVINDAALANLTGDAGMEKSRKKSKKTKASSSDKIPDVVLPIGEDNSEKTGNKVHKSHQIVEKRIDSEILQKSVAVGETAEAYTSDRQLDKERLEPKISLPAEKNIQPHNHCGIQQQADIADGKEESGKDTKIAEETAHVTGGDAGVISLEKKRRKKKKATSIEGLTNETAVNESGQEKGADLILEKEIVKDAVNAVAVDETAEAYTSDCQLDKERLAPEISLPAENDIQSHNHYGIQQQADIADGKEEIGKDTKITKETAHVTGGDPGVSSLEKKRRKKKKVTSIEGLANENAVNESGQEKGADLILEKEIVKDAVNAGTDLGVVSVEKRRHKKTKAAFSGGLIEKPSIEEAESLKERESNLDVEKEKSSRTENAISCPGGDHEVAPKEKRKRKKSSAASTGVPHQEQLDNGSSKAGANHLMLEKEAQFEVDSAHLTENADGVPLSSLKSTVLEDPMYIASDILADLKKGSPIISDGQIDTAPPIIDNEIESREAFGPASSEKDGTRNQTLFSNKVEDSVDGGKGKKRRKQEATNSEAKVTIDGASYEANDSVNISLSQTDLSVEKEPQTKFQKALEEDDVPADMSFVDKSLKDESKEQRVVDKLGDAFVADETTQNAPSTPEKMQQCGDYNAVEIRDKEASIEAVPTKGSEDFHAPVTEKIRFMDYFSHKDSDRPTDTMSVPVKETKGNKKTQNSFSKDSPSASVDTRVSTRSKKSGTTKRPVKSSKEHNRNETSNDTSRVRTRKEDDVSSKNRKMKSSLADMAVMSDASTEDEGVVGSQMRRPMGAVRKFSSKAIGEKINASRKTSVFFSSDGLDDNVAISASAQEESGSEIRGSPVPKKKKGRAMMSPSSSWKDEQLPDDYVPMSQEPTRPKKIVDLGSILKSSSSYKKAKLSASQSEDREMIDVVFETQPDHI